MALSIRIARFLSCLFLLSGNLQAAGATSPAAEKSMAEGEALFATGQFEESIQRWEKAFRFFKKANDPSGQVDALLRSAAGAAAIGQHNLALKFLDSADGLAEQPAASIKKTEVQAIRASLSIFSQDAEVTTESLERCLKIAREQKDRTLETSVLNDLGVLQNALGQSTEALASFQQALALSASELSIACKIRKNLADAALTAKDLPGALNWVRQNAEAVPTLADSHDKAFLLMATAQLLQSLYIEAPEHDNSLRAQALKLDQLAAQVAETIGDQRALSYALGYQGALYEFERRFPEALTLTRRAIFYAQRVQSPDALYRWEWQAGRLLAQLGERQPAIETYRRAVRTLQSIRNDVSTRFGNRVAGSSFRQTAGALYFELADLLLLSTDSLKKDKEIQEVFREARDTTELLKSAELEDYFQDSCVNLKRSKTKKVESISPTAAIIYIIPLPSRTEMIVSLPSGKLERVQSKLNSKELTEIVRNFRVNLEDRTSNEYFEQAQLLYSGLITPLEALMRKNHLDTMVFVPDGPLRTIPMAALHDGEHFLVEKYAIAISPGLELMEAKATKSAPAKVLISALSESVQGFPGLPNVPQEVANLEKLFHQSGAMMNKDFSHAALGKKFTSEEFTIVHIASHGHFDKDVRKSFILTFDKQLTLNELESFIRPAQLREHPLELLTLSACQTAAGDDRAALGLAGIAVKAGARSAFATLWFVNDQASTNLVSDFYQQLVKHPENSKAQALQAAQKALLSQENYAHPCFWAPYLIIGNWL